jgi:hypothetical protein
MMAGHDPAYDDLGARCRMACYDCKRGSEFYMVRRETWVRAWPEYDSLRREILAKRRELLRDPDRAFPVSKFLLLCFDCLERRLGRPLTVDDFDLDLIVNEPIRLGMRLGASSARARVDSGPHPVAESVEGSGTGTG